MVEQTGHSGASPRRWIAIKVDAGHTTNGNPRRGWAVINTRQGELVDFVDEGYQGISALMRAYPDAVEALQLEVAPKEYRDLLKFAREQEEKHKRGEI